MTDNGVERRLAAILAADVAGYSRLMGADEEGVLARLKAARKSLVDPTIAAHRGRIVKTTGDGVLVEFASAVDATRCAIEIQRGMAEQNAALPEIRRLEYRIGVHVGDIIVDDNDIFGDGVNIAARLEGIADPGGVCISDDAQRQIRGKVDTPFEDMGSQSLKNIAEPMRAWRLRINGSGCVAAPIEPPIESTQALALPDKPSIAVLPFENMSGDPEQEYFADGIVEDIITALSRFRSLFVIARNSSFSYKGKSPDIRVVGRELGVRYVLQGSVRKASDRLRITGQLIDSQTGAHLWAERFDGAIEDVFELQDQITAKVIGQIAPRIEQAEIERIRRKPVQNLDAYDFFLRGMASFHVYTKESLREAWRHFRRATELDRSYASPLAMGAWCVAQFKANGSLKDETELTEGVTWARRAAAVGKDDPVALGPAGHCVAYLAGDVETGSAYLDRALTLNPNLAVAWSVRGWLHVYAGNAEPAVACFERAIRLSPLDPLAHFTDSGLAFAHFVAGRYEEAAAWASKAVQEQPNFATSLRIAAVSFALAGRDVEAREAVARLQELDPLARLGNLAQVAAPFRRPEHLANFTRGLRKAGLPE